MSDATATLDLYQENTHLKGLLAAQAGLLSHIALSKYADGLPLYRQTRMFKCIGVALNRTHLANWMIKTGDLIQPLINLLQDRLHEQPILHLDETVVQVLKEDGKKAQSQSYMFGDNSLLSR